MNADTRLRAECLGALDPLFATAGFVRRKNGHLWRRKVSPELVHAVHVNFGLYGTSIVANPSIGVRHESVERALVACAVTQPVAERPTFSKMLGELAGGTYSAELAAGPSEITSSIWADWCAVGRPFVEEVSDLDAAIRRLESTEVREWCCASRADRARLLPVALAVAGRRVEALAWLDRLRADISGRDQAIPAFAEFAERFRRIAV